jgi:beta-lactamase class D
MGVGREFEATNERPPVNACLSRSENPCMTRRTRFCLCLTLLTSAVPNAHVATRTPSQEPAATQMASCFLLFELNVGEIRRNPSDACRTRITPASTFKVPHALAALDAGVVKGPKEILRYDGTGRWPESARRDHTLASALRNSVVWYFQRVAQRLGADRETTYLRRLAYGNMDASSGLTTFWIGGSLEITPEEQQTFWVNLYQGKLPIARSSVNAVKEMLIQPAGVVVNAAGEQPFDGPWPPHTIVSAKPGSATDRTGRVVRWLVGHVKRDNRSFVFVSCVIGSQELGPNAAIDLAARSLRAARVL